VVPLIARGRADALYVVNDALRLCAPKRTFANARTHFFDAIETVLQRSNGDHELAAACIQIIRIRAWTVLGGVKNINSASKLRDQPPDLHHGLCRHNAALSSDVNLMFISVPPRNNCPNRLNSEQFDEIGVPIRERGGEVKNWGPEIHQIF
jgi:hypothetical protein